MPETNLAQAIEVTNDTGSAYDTNIKFLLADRQINKESSKNILISMLENLLLQTDVEKKKRILTEKYDMIMTTELEGRIQTMCNLSENIKAMGIEEGIEQGIEKGVERERLNAIERMIKANASKEQIISFGYTEEEFAKVESALCVNS